PVVPDTHRRLGGCAGVVCRVFGAWLCAPADGVVRTAPSRPDRQHRNPGAARETGAFRPGVVTGRRARRRRFRADWLVAAVERRGGGGLVAGWGRGLAARAVGAVRARAQAWARGSAVWAPWVRGRRWCARGGGR